MKQIILDTNFLLIPFTRNVDIFSEIERIIFEPYNTCILKETIEELNKIIKEQRGKHKDAAKMALQLIEKKQINILDESSLLKQKDLNRNDYSKDSVVDDIIVKIADSETIVATQDRELKKRLKSQDIRIIFLKNKKLEIEDVL